MAPHLGPFFLFRPSKTDIRALEKRIPTYVTKHLANSTPPLTPWPPHAPPVPRPHIPQTAIQFPPRRIHDLGIHHPQRPPRTQCMGHPMFSIPNRPRQTSLSTSHQRSSTLAPFQLQLGLHQRPPPQSRLPSGGHSPIPPPVVHEPSGHHRRNPHSQALLLLPHHPARPSNIRRRTIFCRMG